MTGSPISDMVPVCSAAEVTYVTECNVEKSIFLI